MISCMMLIPPSSPYLGAIKTIVREAESGKVSEQRTVRDEVLIPHKREDKGDHRKKYIGGDKTEGYPCNFSVDT